MNMSHLYLSPAPHWSFPCEAGSVIPKFFCKLLTGRPKTLENPRGELWVGRALWMGFSFSRFYDWQSLVAKSAFLGGRATVNETWLLSFELISQAWGSLLLLSSSESFHDSASPFFFQIPHLIFLLTSGSKSTSRVLPT